MDEKVINRVIGKSMDWYHKISDAGMGQKPFDSFGVYKGKAIYTEAKYLPKPKSFNFNRLEDHQIENLLEIENQKTNNIIPLLLIAVNFGRADVRVFYYKDMHEIFKRKTEKRNILKKEFESSKNFVTIKKSLINLEDIL